MKAIVQNGYGSADLLKLTDVPKPTVGPKDVLVRVHAASINKGDVFLLTGKPYLIRLVSGLRTPKVQVAGVAMAGCVAEVGSEVTRFAVGQEVYAEVQRGGFAEYTCVPEDSLALKPRNLSFAEAAAIPVAAPTALQGLRDVGGLKPGQRALINGASGGVGTYAIQFAKLLGAHVTAVCSTRNVDQARSLGADVVVDYTQEDFVSRGETYDVVLDLVNNRTLGEWRQVLTEAGVYVSSGVSGGDWLGPIPWLIRLAITSPFISQNLMTFGQEVRASDLEYIAELVEQGQIVPVIEAHFPLSQTADALRHVGAGHATGKTVISVVAMTA